MLTPCKDCGHRLWSEVRKVGASRLVVHFDDDERSGTYAEHAPRCPGCAARLDRGLPEFVPGSHPPGRG